MNLFKKKPNALERLRLTGLVDEALSRTETPPSLADECEHVRTAQGRTAHLRHPELGVLCPFGTAAEVKADPSLPVCRMCQDAAAAIDDLRPAS